MKKKILVSIILFVLLNTCIILYIALKAKSSAQSPPDIKTINLDAATYVVVAIDSLSNTYLNNHHLSIDNIEIMLDSVKSKSDIQQLVLESHPNCNVDTLKRVARVAANSGLTVHVRR